MLPIWWCGCVAFGVEVCIIGTACIDTSLVDDIFSLETDSDLREIVPRLSLPLLMVIYCEKESKEELCEAEIFGYVLSRYHKVVEESQVAVQIPSFQLRMLDIIGRVTLQENLSSSVLLSDRLESPFSFRCCAGEEMKCIKINWKMKIESGQRNATQTDTSAPHVETN